MLWTYKKHTTIAWQDSNSLLRGIQWVIGVGGATCYQYTVIYCCHDIENLYIIYHEINTYQWYRTFEYKHETPHCRCIPQIKATDVN